MWAQGAALVLLILAAAAVWQAVVAVNARQTAEAQRDRAERTLTQIEANANRRVAALSVHSAQDIQPRHGDAALRSIDERNDTSTDPEVALKNAKELLALSSSFFTKDNPLAAFKAAERARSILESQVHLRLEVKWQQTLIEAFYSYAQVAEKIGEQEQTEIALQKGLQIARTLAEANQGDVTLMRIEAFVKQELGSWYLRQKRFGEADMHYRQALTIRTSIVSARPILETQRELADSFSRMGDLFEAQKNTTEAVESYKQSVAILTQLMNSDPTNADVRRDLASSLDRLGAVQEMLGNWDEKRAKYQNPLAIDKALDSYQKALAIYDGIGVDQAPHPSSWRRDMAVVLEAIGKLLARRDRADQAIDAFRCALAIRESLAVSFEEMDWQLELEEAYWRISKLVWKMGRFQDALETAEQYLLATALSSDSGAEKPLRVGRALGTLCWSALLAENFDRAVWAGKQGTRLAPDRDWIKTNYAHALMLKGESAEARQIYLDGLNKNPAEAKKRIGEDFAVLQERNFSRVSEPEVANLMQEIAGQLNP